jgi:hypothetical protein
MIYDEREEDTDIGDPSALFAEAEEEEEEEDELGGGSETPEEEEAYE